jgi:histidine ammonia-lyase
MSVHLISNDFLSIDHIEELLEKEMTLALSPVSKDQILSCFQYLEDKLNQEHKPIYGVNTGFGALCNVIINKDQLAELQKNLICSHACGTGNVLPESVVKLMLLLKIQSLSYGHSGVKPETVERLIYFYNNDIFPVIYEFGSLGASGDLAPLAHLALPLIGLGQVRYQGQTITTQELYNRLHLQPLTLAPKEGLALLNGTEFMKALGVQIVVELRKLLLWADIIAAMSLDAFDCRLEPFHPLLQQIRPHSGQISTAARISKLLQDSEIAHQPKTNVQDPYSFRCIPQVHGAVYELIANATETIQTEINGVSDNPNIFAQEDLILSGGNFHGQEIAIALDMMAIGMAHLAGISERRTYQLQSGKRGLPAFLIDDPGLQSGLMILQYTAAGLVNEMRHQAVPHSLDSIPSCNGQEDFVSMGANAGIKCCKMVKNLRKVLSIELIHAYQGLSFRKPMRTGTFLNTILSEYEKVVPPIHHDRIFSYDLTQTEQFLAHFPLDTTFFL